MSVTLGMNQLEALEAGESLQRQRAKEAERERDMWKAATRHAEGERDEALTAVSYTHLTLPTKA